MKSLIDYLDDKPLLIDGMSASKSFINDLGFGNMKDFVWGGVLDSWPIKNDVVIGTIQSIIV